MVFLDLDFTFTPVYSESVFNKLKSHVGGLLEPLSWFCLRASKHQAWKGLSAF